MKPWIRLQSMYSMCADKFFQNAKFCFRQQKAEDMCCPAGIHDPGNCREQKR